MHQTRKQTQRKTQSLSARRAWIEIPAGCWRDSRRAVALRKESVDRNYTMQVIIIIVDTVALRKESVDRNALLLGTVTTYNTSLSARRAWIEMFAVVAASLAAVSLSARRAWIEIAARASSLAIRSWSLSARRAWIEMEYTLYCPPFGEVALRKESVDRNVVVVHDLIKCTGRSPQGERG